MPTLLIMERRFAVKTGELVSFEYELAGAGSRFIALMIDSLIQILALTLLLVVSALQQWQLAKIVNMSEKGGGPYLAAFVLLLLFIIFFGYFIIFEIVWHGQTPGKRLLHIRVVRDGGQRSDPVTIVTRNLIRIVEAGLFFYFISFIVMVISPENKRLGDYAAGTIVIRD